MDLEAQLTQLRERCQRQAEELTHLRTVLEVKNRALDALHYVWCSGGCSSGVHRYQEEPPDAKTVAEGLHNAGRLYTWFISSKGKGAKIEPGLRQHRKAWRHARNEIALATVDALLTRLWLKLSAFFR